MQRTLKNSAADFWCYTNLTVCVADLDNWKRIHKYDRLIKTQLGE